MRIEHCDWPEEGIKTLDNHLSSYAKRFESPMIGVWIGWNEPKRWWKPYFGAQFGPWRIEVGWIY